MTSIDIRPAIVGAWRTNSRTTAFLVEHITAPLWSAAVPESPRRTIGMIAAHMHNARCSWLRTLGRPHGLDVPESVDRRAVTRRALLTALKQSGRAMTALLELGFDCGGSIPPTKAYVWRNLPLDVPHVLTYFVAHEAHHRGQIVMVARQLGQRLPSDVVNGIWQWNRRAKEST